MTTTIALVVGVVLAAWLPREAQERLLRISLLPVLVLGVLLGTGARGNFGGPRRRRRR